MTEEVITENQEPQKANPYNAKKDWHDVKDKPFVSSDSLFFDNLFQLNMTKVMPLKQKNKK